MVNAGIGFFEVDDIVSGSIQYNILVVGNDEDEIVIIYVGVVEGQFICNVIIYIKCNFGSVIFQVNVISVLYLFNEVQLIVRKIKIFIV